jgi:hypothetical protein
MTGGRGIAAALFGGAILLALVTHGPAAPIPHLGLAAGEHSVSVPILIVSTGLRP